MKTIRLITMTHHTQTIHTPTLCHLFLILKQIKKSLPSKITTPLPTKMLWAATHHLPSTAMHLLSITITPPPMQSTLPHPIISTMKMLCLIMMIHPSTINMAKTHTTQSKNKMRLTITTPTTILITQETPLLNAMILPLCIIVTIPTTTSILITREHSWFLF